MPIIFLSSMNDNMNIVMAMNMGGDEFIEKPFDLNVVTAKVQAVLRRAYALQGTANIIEHGEMLLNLGDASLTIAGQKIELTKNEFKICQMFFESAGKFVTRDAIMTRLWESDEFIDDNTLTVNVARLRKKLEEAGMHDVIRTKKGIRVHAGMTEILRAFWKEKRPERIAVLVSGILFAVIFWIYEIPVEIAGYAFLLVILWNVIWFTLVSYDMKKDKEYWKKIREKSGQRQEDFRRQEAGKAKCTRN